MRIKYLLLKEKNYTNVNNLLFISVKTFKFSKAVLLLKYSKNKNYFQVSEDQVKKFLIEIQNNKNLLDQVVSVGTADDIAKIANDSGFKFTGSELKNISGKVVNGVKIKTQDTSPSYNFGEGGN